MLSVPGTMLGPGDVASMIESQFLAVDRFDFDQAIGQANKRGAAAFDDVAHAFDGVVNDAANFLVDFAGCLLAMVTHCSFVTAAGEKRRAIAFAIIHAAQPAHAVFHHHAAGDFGRALQVVLRAG